MGHGSIWRYCASAQAGIGGLRGGAIDRYGGSPEDAIGYRASRRSATIATNSASSRS